MKKFLSLMLALVILVSTLWVSVGKAAAAGLITYQGGLFVWGKGVVFVFEGAEYRNRDVKNASIYAGSSRHNLYCTVNKDEDRIVCVAGSTLADHAGEGGIIYLAGQSFYVTIPSRPLLTNSSSAGGGEAGEGSEGGGGSVCDVWGANVSFEDVDGDSSTEFVQGNTITEVTAAADAALAHDQDLVGYSIVSGLYCR